VRRIREAGFVVLGKTNTPELGTIGVTESLTSANRLRICCAMPKRSSGRSARHSNIARGRQCDDGVMSRRAIKLAALALLVAWLSVLIYAAVASRADTSRPNVLSMKVNGVVDPFMASYIKRGIETAVDPPASASPPNQ